MVAFSQQLCIQLLAERLNEVQPERIPSAPFESFGQPDTIVSDLDLDFLFVGMRF